MSDRDDFDDLKRLLAENPAPPAPEAARARALAAARAAFADAATAESAEAATATTTAESEKSLAIHQGTEDVTRQRDRQTGLMTLIRRRLMNLSLPSTKQMMMGGASVAVLALAVMAVQNQDMGLGKLNGLSGGDKETNTPAPTTTDAPSGLARTEAPVDGSVTTGTRADADVEREAPGEPRVTPDAPKKLGGTTADLRDSVDEAPAAPAPMVAEEKAEADARSAVAGAARERAQRREERFGFKGDGAGAANRGTVSNDDVVRHFNGNSAAKGGVGQLAKPKTRAVPLVEAEPAPADGYSETGRDKFPDAEPNQVKVVADEPVSTFSVDVDTASYSFMRKALNRGVLPAKDSIRIEELVNYFPYDYRAPENSDTPFSANVTVMETPWNTGTKLMRIGIKGYEIKAAEKPRSNLVFLIDTSGSMNAADKLPLLIQSFEMLLETLGKDDTVSIVAYAGSAGTVLEPTKASDKAAIRAALHRLSAGGSTAGGQGIKLAYDLAQANFDKDGVNRVILATDGDFNVGIRNQNELKGFIERKRDTGVFLSVLGFGRGNYNDALMQTLAQNGNGQAAYIDTVSEARKVLVDEASSTLFTIAKDVKIQVDFNPNVVAEYRLIGYETRKLNREDFNNDKVDAAEVGAGHSITAIYEITPVGSDARLVDPSRYDTPAAGDADKAGEYAFVKIRYKEPDADTSKLITRPVTKADESAPDDDARFAASVAAFGQLLKGGRYTGAFTFDDVIKLANGAKGDDPYNYRGEFVQLVRAAKQAKAMERQ